MSTLKPEPPQPPSSDWKFVEELQSPLWQEIRWRRRRQKANEASLQGGVSVQARFRDEAGRLATAYQDLERFLEAAGISRHGPYQIATAEDDTLDREAYRLVITPTGCQVLAADPEGIRRAIFFLEDEMLRAGGPFLPLGTIERRPVIRTRISRCFFGPIHRPPHNRDELTDDVNYYPDEYLNRLAHEGVNGLWLTIHFSEICRTAAIPEYGRDADRRVAKLRRTVEQCARYGIKIYAFANEPIPIQVDSEVAKAHPELVGHGHGSRRYFCTSNPTAQAYLEEAMYNLFSEVPGLGGLVNISIGEGGSHCYSGWLKEKNTCPRCANRDPQDVLNEALAAMERGMHAASPEAEMISWPYGQYVLWGDEATVDSAGRLPEGVMLLHNFESSGEAEQCGRMHKIQDYWLSWVGPSKLFSDCARAAVRNGNRMGAKLQVGCSHEVATVPFVPVPGHLYRKYRAMRELGVSAVMQCWYFGNYPGIMTKAAGELAFDPVAESEDEFLLWLAQRDWGDHAGEVVRAWQLFQSGYSNFPLNHVFGWYGPVHDAPTWPLHLEPADAPIAPSWLRAWRGSGEPIAASGDRIGECFAYTHSLEEVLALTGAMAHDWNRGVDILKGLLPHYAGDEARRRDIGVAAALGIQMESAHNMLRFYSLREELPYLSQAEQLEKLNEMRRIVERELERGAELLALCREDSRLGFHSEAEGYKYFPAKIEWRMEQLRGLLAEDFPRLEAQIQRREPLWPQYTGKQPEGVVYRCRRANTPPALDGVPAGPAWDDMEEVELGFRELLRDGQRVAAADEGELAGLRTFWKAGYDREALYVGVRCQGKASLAGEEAAHLLIEPRRLWPNQRYEVGKDGSYRCRKYPAPDDERWQAVVAQDEDGWSVTARIPFACLEDGRPPERPLRLDVERTLMLPEGTVAHSWMERHPLGSRLVFGTANPADLGWLILS